MLLPYTYIATDTDEEHQEELSAIQHRQARLFARSWFQCYVKIKHFHPRLLANANLSIKGIVYDNLQATKNEDKFVEYVAANLGGLDDEFGDYYLDLKDKVEDLVKKCPDTKQFNNHVLNRFAYFSRELAHITANIACSPSSGRNKAKQLKETLGVA